MIRYFILVAFMVFSSFYNVSGQTVNGKVISKIYGPLQGATIWIPHTNIGTVSDKEGNYLIILDSSYNAIRFDFVGHEGEEVSINNDTILNITLEESPIELNEIIIKGIYPNVRKRVIAPEIKIIKRNGLFRKPDTIIVGGGIPDSTFNRMEAERKRKISDSININSHKLNDSINFIKNLTSVEKNFRKYFIDSIEYPKTALINSIHGKVYVRFTINEESRISDIKILRSVDSILDNEVLSLLQQMPDDIQKEFGKYGKLYNRQVPKKFDVRIKFELIEMK